RFERMAEHLDGALLIVHHATKGSQSEKRVVDVGAGAGSQSRSADCHIALREHEVDDCVVFDARVRSFKPPAPMVLRWTYPLWERDLALDPTQLKTGGRRRAAEDDQPAAPAWTPERFAAEIVSAQPQDKTTIMAKGGNFDLSERTAAKLLALAES